MDDFIGEIDREMRAERWRGLWKRYGGFVIGAAALVVVAVAGREGFVAWRDARQTAAADAYLAALISSDAGDNAALVELATEGGAGYPMLARLHYANDLAEAGDRAGAEAAYLELAADTGIEAVYRDAALLLSVMNAPPGTSADERIGRLEKITGPGNPWRFLGYEMLIGIALEQGNIAAARDYITALRSIAEIPADTEQRLRTIETVIEAGS